MSRRETRYNRRIRPSTFGTEEEEEKQTLCGWNSPCSTFWVGFVAFSKMKIVILNDATPCWATSVLHFSFPQHNNECRDEAASSDVNRLPRREREREAVFLAFWLGGLSSDKRRKKGYNNSYSNQDQLFHKSWVALYSVRISKNVMKLMWHFNKPIEKLGFLASLQIMFLIAI